MTAGTPLTDADRAPWIDELARAVEANPPTTPVVLACSALTQIVRAQLIDGVSHPIHWVLLDVPKHELRRRMTERAHFMSPDLLESQIEALDAPKDALVFDATTPIATLVGEIRHALPF